MNRLNFTSILVYFIVVAAYGQNLPQTTRLVDNDRFLITDGYSTSALYDDTKINEIRLYFKESNYWNLLQNNYKQKINLMARMTYNGIVLDSIGVRFKGQTSYNGGPGGGGSSANSQKKSFNLSLDAFVDGRDIEGYNTLNLNNSFQDASFMREVVYYNILKKHLPAPKAGFVRLYINDQDWGIYQNIQQLNKDFLKEWWKNNDGTNFRADTPNGTFGGGTGGGPSWGDGTAAINYLGEDTTLYQKYYTLKSDKSGAPWINLIDAAKILSQTPTVDLHIALQDHFDLDRILWHLASENLFADDDSYIYKGKMDYYLYRDQETGRITTFDYDANSVMINNNQDWSPFYNESKSNYPLLNKLLANQNLRQRYIAHMKTLISEYADEGSFSQRLERYQSLIDASVNVDSKKATTYAAFTSSKQQLVNFMAFRKSKINAHAEFSQVSPSASNLRYGTTKEWLAPLEGESCTVHVKASHNAGISKVRLYYCADIFGKFSNTVEMYDDGQNGDPVANDGDYTGILPALSAGTWVRSYCEIVANNASKTVTYIPAGAEHHVMVYQVRPLQSLTSDVVINEIMPANENGPKDENGSTADWIELYNKSNTTVDLSEWYLSDNLTNVKKFQIPNGVKIPANGYLIFWCDEDQKQGNTHTSFKLSTLGETIILSDKDGKLTDSITYTNAQKDVSIARIPNGTGNFEFRSQHTFNANNNPTTALGQNDLVTVKIYPNPVHNYLQVIGIDRTAQLEIYDVKGNKVMETTYSNGKIVDVTLLGSGLYFLKSDKKFVGKFIK